VSAAKAALLRPPAGPISAPAPGPGKQASFAGIALCLAVSTAALFAAYFSTAASFVHIWLRSATFAHGCVVPLISAWLLFRRRDQLRCIDLRPWPPALLFIATIGAVWLLSSLAFVQVMQQYCLVLLLIATTAAVAGPELIRAAAFPFSYLLLAVPFGEVLVQPLMNFTANFTVLLLQATGIPIFRENNYLALPSGNWSVAEACSGLRYLVATFALGTLYAHLAYRSLKRRLAFIAVSLVLPLIANGLRACLIVLIGHWTDMRWATGIDHLLYGWIFFGLVITLLFWTGARWRERDYPAEQSQRTAPPHESTALIRFAAMAIVAVATAAIWPTWASLAMQEPAVRPGAAITLPPPPPPWSSHELQHSEWRELHAGTPQSCAASYSDGQRKVSLQIARYAHQSKGNELLAPIAQLEWNEISSTQHQISIGGRTFGIRESIQQSGNVKLLVWRWYRQAAVDTGNPYLVKLMLARAKLFGGDDSGTEIALASAYDEQIEPAEAAMHDLLTAMLPSIDKELGHASH